MVFDVARKNGPSAIFIDHVESVLPLSGKIRSGFDQRLISSFASRMQELAFSSEQVLVIGSTNKFHRIDERALEMFEGKFKLY